MDPISLLNALNENRRYGEIQQNALAQQQAREAATRNQYLPQALDQGQQLNALKIQQQQAESPTWAPSAQADLKRKQFQADNPFASSGGLGGLYAEKDYYTKLGQTDKANQLQKLIDNQVNYQNALTQYRLQGGFGRGSADIQVRANLDKELKNAFPNTSPERLNEIEEAYRSGNNTLKDGTILPPIPRRLDDAISLMVGKTVPRAVSTGLIQGAQAEKELGVINGYMQRAVEKLGPSYLGISPYEIIEDLRADPKNDETIGMIGAAVTGQAEQNMIRQKLASGTPTATVFKEMQEMTPSLINAKFPKLTAGQKLAIIRQTNQMFQDMYKARASVGSSYSAVGKIPKDDKNTKELTYNPKTGRLE